MRPHIAPHGGNGPSTGGSEASFSTQASVWFRAIPPVTRAVMVLCTAVYLAMLISGWDNYGAVCLSPQLFISRLQWWRAYSAVIVHAGFLHLLFNMMTLWSLRFLEYELGSARLAYLMTLSAFMSACVSGALGLALQFSGVHFLQAMGYGCMVGLSGVLFTLIVVEQHASPGGAASPRSLLGLFSVPGAYYPWALLLLYQVMMPGVSFLGHLSGLLVGWLYAHRQLAPLVPSDASLSWAADLPPRYLGRGWALGLLPPGGAPATHDGPAPTGTYGNMPSGAWVGQQLTAWRAFFAGGAASAQPAPASTPVARGHTLGGGGAGPAASRLLSGGKPVAPGTLGGVFEPPSAAGGPSASAADGYARETPSLVEMGFPFQVARAALIEAKGDITAAVELLAPQH